MSVCLFVFLFVCFAVVVTDSPSSLSDYLGTKIRFIGFVWERNGFALKVNYSYIL